MHLTVEAILIAVIIMALNVMDSVTTRWCVKQYPDKALKGESNPLMRRLMLKNAKLAEFVKQGGVLALVAYALFYAEMEVLRIFAIMLALVVLNNTCIVLSRATMKRKVKSPLERLRLLLHISGRYSYVMAVAIIVLLAFWIHNLIW